MNNIMQRNFKTMAFAISMLAVVSSCDIMDTRPLASFDDEAVWGSKESAEAFINNTYRSTVDLYANGGIGCSWASRTPDGCQCDQVFPSIDGIATELGVSNYGDMGFDRFGTLRACNLIIDKVEKSDLLTDDQKAQFIAEAKFLRGCVFFDQARKMGRFVPVTKLLNVNDTTEFLKPITQSVDESYKYVMDDFDAAIEGLPEVSTLERANKYAAHLFRTRAGLQAYAYTKDETYLDKVIESANAIINSQKYRLTEKYGDIFNDVSPRDPEIILARYFLEENTYVSQIPEMIQCVGTFTASDIELCGGTAPTTNTDYFTGAGVFWPTQDLVDQFLQIDEKTGEAKNWWETSQYTENVIELDRSNMEVGCVGKGYRGSDLRNFPSSVDMVTGRFDYELFTHYGQVKDDCTRDISDIMYGNRDKRMDYIVVRDKSTWHGWDVGTNLMGNMFQGLRADEAGAYYTTCTGYYYKKGIYNVSKLEGSTPTNYHYIVARLGEAYLNLAEAQLLKKNIPAAVEALNHTRMTHGGLPASTASTEEAAWADYMRERRCDMAEEGGDIYFSYLRWGKYGGYANYGREPGAVIKDLDRPVYKICISQDRKKYSIGQLTLQKSENRHFTVRRYLFPIPQGQIDTRSVYGIKDGQNEGW